MRRKCANDNANVVVRYPTYGDLVTNAIGGEITPANGLIPAAEVFFVFDARYITFEGQEGSVSNIEGFFNKNINNTGSFVLLNPDSPIRIQPRDGSEYSGQLVIDTQQLGYTFEKPNPVYLRASAPYRKKDWLGISNVRVSYPARSVPANYAVRVSRSVGRDYYVLSQDEPRFEWKECDEIKKEECPEGTCEVTCGDTICCYGSDGIAVQNFP